MQWPWKTSLLLLIFGFLVVFFSLQSLHGKVIAQEMESADTALQDECKFEHWLDPSLPGSLPYVAGRASDRIELITISQDEKPEELCQRSKHRLDASRYAWEKNHRADAVETLRKSFIYLSQVNPEDRTPDCTDTLSELKKTIDGWCGQVNCQENSVLAKTRSQTEAIQ